MRCLNCDNRMRVIDSRSEDNITYRRYRCDGCGAFLYTEEKQDGKAKRKITKLVNQRKERDNG